jgi:selenide,water dikinase
MSEEIRLTQFSHGAGCGCKIAPHVLEQILHGQRGLKNESLLVGNETSDDAAVYDIGGGRAVISTADFFMPIVDDAFDFGRIAAANALSDVYAMGGKALFAIAILGWPVEKIPTEVAQKVIEGARKVCEAANIVLAGGHSIDSKEPIFGLSVTGEVLIENIKRNSTAEKGNKLFLTKPIGVGMVTTAHKRGLAEKSDMEEAISSMTSLNLIGHELGNLDYVKAMTDVTGFGLLGHLIEMCVGSGLSAEIEYERVPKLKNIDHYISKMIYPDITFRTWKSYESKVQGIASESLLTLCDPQTSGGLLVSVDAGFEIEFISFCAKAGCHMQSIGQFVEKKEKTVYIL